MGIRGIISNVYWGYVMIFLFINIFNTLANDNRVLIKNKKNPYFSSAELNWDFSKEKLCDYFTIVIFYSKQNIF